MLFIEAKDKFLIYIEAKGDRPRTVATYDQRLRLFVEETGLNSLVEIGPEAVDAWVVAMRRRGLAAATVANRLRDIKTFFSWCVGRGYLATSPAGHLPVRGRWVQSEIKAMERETLLALLAAADTARDVAIVRFIASTGCRSGEAASVRISDVNMTRREARVTGKSGPRAVDFDLSTCNALATWLDEHPNTGSGYLFVALRPPHTPATPGMIYQLFRRLAQAANVDGRFNPHALRHLVGQTWTDETNLELTRQKLGHRDITTTMVYANQDRGRLKEATDRISIL